MRGSKIRYASEWSVRMHLHMYYLIEMKLSILCNFIPKAGHIRGAGWIVATAMNKYAYERVIISNNEFYVLLW